jgi:hypothetical protein
LVVDGPGALLIRAGRNVDLGASQGILTASSTKALSTGGANVSVSAGLGACRGAACAPAYGVFAAAYLDPAGANANLDGNVSLLQAYMQKLTGIANLGVGEAWAAYGQLSSDQQAGLVEQVLANELHLSGLAHNVRGVNFAQGYDAIGTLFPGSVIDSNTGRAVDFLHPATVGGVVSTNGNLNLAKGTLNAGNIALVYSQVRTLGGGDIGVYTPYGGLDVGLANQPPGTPHKGAGGLGIVTQDSGSVRGVAAENMNVNASRIFTVGGGDIVLWSSFGNIDAGKGAKTVAVVPPPSFQFDSSGKLEITLSGATSGSGIGALLTGPGQVPGNVDLIAPVGIVDAGDAGIRASGNLNIAAAQVLNAANIAVGGTATGVPVTDVPTISAPAPSSSATSNATQSSEDANRRVVEEARRAETLQSQFRPTIVTVDVVGEDEGASPICAQPPCRDRSKLH